MTQCGAYVLYSNMAHGQEVSLQWYTIAICLVNMFLLVRRRIFPGHNPDISPPVRPAGFKPRHLTLSTAAQHLSTPAHNTPHSTAVPLSSYCHGHHYDRIVSSNAPATRAARNHLLALLRARETGTGQVLWRGQVQVQVRTVEGMQEDLL